MFYLKEIFVLHSPTDNALVCEKLCLKILKKKKNKLKQNTQDFY